MPNPKMPLVLAAALLAASAASTAPAPPGERPARQGHTRHVAILVYDGVEVLDVAGPAEVFEIAGRYGGQGEDPAFSVFTVASSRESIESQGFLGVLPDYAFSEAPRIDLLVVPGGRTGKVVGDPASLDWIRRTAEGADLTLTVCTGAMILAETGLLDGHPATTWHGALERLARDFPQVHGQPGRRFVDAGRFVTTAGVSAGIDGSLHVVARLLGRHVAEQASRYMEYPWAPEAIQAGSYSWLNPTLDRRGRAVQQADLLLDGGSLPEAAAAYRALVAESPDDARSWYRLGKALLALDDFAGAVAASQRAASSERLRAFAEYNSACAYSRAGDRDAAFSHLDRAVAAGLRVSPAYLRQDSDLEPLREDPRFEAILTQLEAFRRDG
jgi:putative intracellular protease/amidase